jgi:hypothetical protein
VQVVATEQRVGARADHPGIHVEQPQRRSVDRFDAAVGVERHHSRGDALEHRLDVAAAFVELQVLPLEVEPGMLDLLLAGRQPAGHRVERLDERPELVAGFRLDPVIEVACADFARARRQPLHRPRDPLGEIQPHPCGAHQDHQSHGQEQRQIDALERPLHHGDFVVFLVGLRDASGVRRELTGEMVAGDHHSGDRAFAVAHKGAGAHELAAPFERLERLGVGGAGNQAGSQDVCRGRRLSARQRRRLHRDQRRNRQRRAGSARHPIHLHQRNPAFRHFRGNQPADALTVATRQHRGRQRRGDPRGARLDASLAFPVVVRRNLR